MWVGGGVIRRGEGGRYSLCDMDLASSDVRVIVIYIRGMYVVGVGLRVG